MRVFIGICIAVIIAAGVGHYLLWNQQVEQFDRFVNQSLQKLYPNENGEAPLVTFAYGSKETGGYPMDAEVRYTNPVIVIADEFYAQQYDIDDMREPATRLDRVALDGTLFVRNSAITSEAAVEMNGSITLEGSEYGKETRIAMDWSDALICSATRNGTALDFVTGNNTLSAASTLREKLRAIRSLECQLTDGSVTDLTTDTLLMSVAKKDVRFDSVPVDEPGKHTLALALKFDDLLFNETKESLISDVKMSLDGSISNVEPIIAALQTQELPWIDKMSVPGDWLINARYTGPVDEMAGSMSAFDLDVSEFVYKDRYSEISYPFAVSVADGLMNIAHDGIAEVHDPEAYNSYVRGLIETLTAIANDPDVQALPEMRGVPVLDADVLMGLIPDYTENSVIKTFVNMSYPVNATSNPDAMAKPFTIDTLGFSSDAYGLMLTGGGVIASMEGKVDIICTHCDALVQDLGDYANAVIRVAIMLDKLQVKHLLDQEAIDAVSSFLNDYDADKKEETLTLTVTPNKENGQLMISNQPAGLFLIDALGKLGKHFEHFLPKQPVR